MELVRCFGDNGERGKHRLADGFEKKGLYQETEILENYGIDSETDVSVPD